LQRIAAKVLVCKVFELTVGLHVGAEQSISRPAPQTKGLPELVDTLYPSSLQVLEPPILLFLDTL
jgi:hypothetical protein